MVARLVWCPLSQVALRVGLAACQVFACLVHHRLRLVLVFVELYQALWPLLLLALHPRAVVVLGIVEVDTAMALPA